MGDGEGFEIKVQEKWTIVDGGDGAIFPTWAS